MQRPSALSLLDFPFLGAAFASRNAAEGGGEGRKIRSFLGEPERPKVLHFASESTRAALGVLEVNMNDIAKREKHISKLEHKLAEARARRQSLVIEQRQAIEAARPGDGAAIAAQAPINKALEAQERLLRSIDREIALARKNLAFAEEQQRHVRRVAASKEAATETKEKWFLVRAPDGRELRHPAHSYASLQRQLLPSYVIEFGDLWCR